MILPRKPPKQEDKPTPVRCFVCGDEEKGPWGVREGRLVCESCLDGPAELPA